MTSAQTHTAPLSGSTVATASRSTCYRGCYLPEAIRRHLRAPEQLAPPGESSRDDRCAPHRPCGCRCPVLRVADSRRSSRSVSRGTPRPARTSSRRAGRRRWRTCASPTAQRTACCPRRIRTGSRRSSPRPASTCRRRLSFPSVASPLTDTRAMRRSRRLPPQAVARKGLDRDHDHIACETA
jgi:hypothetical protein